MNSDDLNKRLQGATDVQSFELRRSKCDGLYSLELILTSNQKSQVTLSCDDVSHFDLKNFGGGLTQFLDLKCVDVTEWQLDRVNLHFEDLENKAIAFDCARAEILES